MSKRKEIPDVMSQLQGLAPAFPFLLFEGEHRLALGTPPARHETTPAARSKNRTPKSRLVGRATYDLG